MPYSVNPLQFVTIVLIPPVRRSGLTPSVAVGRRWANDDRINADRINGDRINGDRINGDRINADRINGDRINGDRINGDRINGDRINADRINERERGGMSMAGDTRRCVLLTGPAGRIGRGFQEEYLRKFREHYDLRIAVHITRGDALISDVVEMDIASLEQVKEACRGVDTVVHLAANADSQAGFCEALLEPNIVGAYNLFEAAHQMGCRRVVYASSIHAVMGYPVDLQVHHDSPPRPDTLYGVTKLFGEGLCSSYSYLHGLSCIALRIGRYVQDDEVEALKHRANPQELDIVVSQRDMAQLIHRCILAPDHLKYAILNGLSNNRYKRLDLESARRLVGYAPEDDAFQWSELLHFTPEEKV